MSLILSFRVKNTVLTTVLLTIVAGVHHGPGTVLADDCPDCVVVAVDLDPGTPGFQTDIEVAPGTEWVRDITIWIYDPSGEASLYSIGYVGGLNRGIAFGHMPDDGQNAGQIVDVSATAVEPVIPGHTAFVNNGIEKLFSGPELQYFEYGSAPGIISADPVQPVVTLDIQLLYAASGDVFRFYLGDMTAAWLAQWPVDPGGAFSTQEVGSLDTGGDAIPDGTVTRFDIDPDLPVPVPPAPFLVDYVDSPGGGGAVIRILPSIPVLSHWGMLAMTLFVLAVGMLVFRRHHRPELA